MLAVINMTSHVNFINSHLISTHGLDIYPLWMSLLLLVLFARKSWHSVVSGINWSFYPVDIQTKIHLVFMRRLANFLIYIILYYIFIIIFFAKVYKKPFSQKKLLAVDRLIFGIKPGEVSRFICLYYWLSQKRSTSLWIDILVNLFFEFVQSLMGFYIK